MLCIHAPWGIPLMLAGAVQRRYTLRVGTGCATSLGSRLRDMMYCIAAPAGALAPAVRCQRRSLWRRPTRGCDARQKAADWRCRPGAVLPALRTRREGRRWIGLHERNGDDCTSTCSRVSTRHRHGCGDWSALAYRTVDTR